eukprot:1550733-Lingulodinium_polyedra.AAC.1
MRPSHCASETLTCGVRFTVLQRGQRDAVSGFITGHWFAVCGLPQRVMHHGHCPAVAPQRGPRDVVAMQRGFRPATASQRGHRHVAC